MIANPTLDQPIEHSACLQFYSDHGIHHGSSKYTYERISSLGEQCDKTYVWRTK